METDLSSLTLAPWEIILRLVCAMLIGAVIGTEREYTHRPAGMRTHMLVALGSCAVMVASQLIFCQYRAVGASPDPTRISAQVITGVGFLGAGTILREGATIKGLTTAASLWAVACLGIAAGAGQYLLAGTGMVCMMIILVVFEWLQKRLILSRQLVCRLHIECCDIAHSLNLLYSLAGELEVRFSALQVESATDTPSVITLKADFSGRRGEKRLQTMLGRLADDGCISAVSTEEHS